MCGPHRRFAPLLSRTLRRIPQAVGAIAIDYIYGTMVDTLNVSFQYRRR